MLSTLYCRYFQRAFFCSVPIGGFAGLIGLGGGEFRLPVLTQLIGFPARAARIFPRFCRHCCSSNGYRLILDG